MNGLYGYRMSGAGAMGSMAAATTTPTDPVSIQMMEDILDGSMASKLQDAKTQNYDDLSTIMKYVNDPDPAKRQAANAARAENLAARLELQKAISSYSTIVGWIQTVAGSYAPPQLSGLGFVGVDDAVYVIGAIAVAGFGIAAALYALSLAFNAYTGHTDTSRGLMDQFAGILDSLSGLTKTIAIVGVVGVIGFFAFPWMKARFGR